MNTDAGKRMGAPCATPNCLGVARWIPTPSVRIAAAEDLHRYRCTECCDAYPWTHVYADPSDGPWRIDCPDCRMGGVTGEFTRDNALIRAREHITQHLADALAYRTHKS